MASLLGLFGLLTAPMLLAGCTSIEDSLLRRGVRSQMAAEAPPIEGMRVVVCGSASPLGNDPERAQACIAVLTPEHFLLFDVGARSPPPIGWTANIASHTTAKTSFPRPPGRCRP